MAAREPKHLHVLIMAGGSGTRFWPRSRVRRPKQLLSLWDERTLLEHTVARFENLVPQENTWIVTNHALVEPSRAALGKNYSAVRYLGEPQARNTAPCILWGIKEILKADANAMVAVMSADSFIGDQKAFLHALLTAVEAAKAEAKIITIGIRPNRPETGYGYIEVDKPVTEASLRGGHAPVSVRQFVEKPDLRTAVRYLESGKYLWNAGMFIFSAATALKAFSQTMPELTSLFESDSSVEKIYAAIRKEDAVSVDYGVMERALEKGIPVAVVPAEFGWNDVGSFTALEEINRSTQGDVVSLDANCNVVQTDRGLVALLGVNDLVVVRDGDVVLVTSKDRAQDIKLLLEKVKAKFPEQL